MAEKEDMDPSGVPVLNKAAMIPTIKTFYPENEQEKYPSSQIASSDLIEPQDATTETLDKQSVLHLNLREGGTILLMPKCLEADGMALIDTFKMDLKEAKEAGKALHECKEEGRGENHQHRSVCLEPGKEACREETMVYKERCEKVTEDVKLLSDMYTKQVEFLEEKVQELMQQIRQKDVEHSISVETIRRERGEKMKELEETVDLQAEMRLMLEHSLVDEQHKVSSLKNLKKEYEKDSEKLEEMRVKLATKEKSNLLLCDEIKTLEKGVAKLKSDNNTYFLIIDKNELTHTKEQLKRCQQIRDMVSLLPNATGEEVDRLTADIATKASDMKACSINKRSTSWIQ